MILRDYTPQVKAAYPALFDSNPDPYFLPQERADFSDFLNKKITASRPG